MNDKNNILDEVFKEEPIVKKESFLRKLNRKIRITPLLLICPVLIILMIMSLNNLSKRNDFSVVIGPEIIFALFITIVLFVMDRIATFYGNQKVVVIIESIFIVILFFWLTPTL